MLFKELTLKEFDGPSLFCAAPAIVTEFRVDTKILNRWESAHKEVQQALSDSFLCDLKVPEEATLLCGFIVKLTMALQEAKAPLHLPASGSLDDTGMARIVIGYYSKFGAKTALNYALNFVSAALGNSSEYLRQHILLMPSVVETQRQTQRRAQRPGRRSRRGPRR